MPFEANKAFQPTRETTTNVIAAATRIRNGGSGVRRGAPGRARTLFRPMARAANRPPPLKGIQPFCGRGCLMGHIRQRDPTDVSQR